MRFALLRRTVAALCGLTTALAAGLSAPAVMADGERSGEVDYYVMALSWSPTWCALEGDARKSVKLPARVVEEAFLKANPAFEPDMVTVTCRSGRIQEVRVCLSKDLDPVPCGQDVVRDCQMKDALLDPVR